jgi:hypothetical protein
MPTFLLTAGGSFPFSKAKWIVHPFTNAPYPEVLFSELQSGATGAVDAWSANLPLRGLWKVSPSLVRNRNKRHKQRRSHVIRSSSSKAM